MKRPLDRAKLAKCCELMASPFDGERAAAALEASVLVGLSGLSWAQILGVEVTTPAVPKPTRRPAPPPPASAHGDSAMGWVRTVLFATSGVSDKDVRFVLSLATKLQRGKPIEAAHLWRLRQLAKAVAEASARRAA